jgi:hypothetical protein
MSPTAIFAQGSLDASGLAFAGFADEVGVGFSGFAVSLVMVKLLRDGEAKVLADWLLPIWERGVGSLLGGACRWSRRANYMSGSELLADRAVSTWAGATKCRSQQLWIAKPGCIRWILWRDGRGGKEPQMF